MIFLNMRAQFYLSEFIFAIFGLRLVFGRRKYFFMRRVFVMKKKLLVVAMLVVVIMTAVLLAGCAADKMQLGFIAEADVTPEYVTINIKDYEGKMLIDLLKAEESLGAKIEGTMLNEIKGIKNDFSKNEFISIYSNMKEYDGGFSDPIIKDDVTYYTTKVGIDELPISKDAKYLFVLSKY